MSRTKPDEATLRGPGPKGADGRAADSRSADDRILTKTECENIASQVASLAKGGGETVPILSSWWTGELRWGRNRVTLASDRRDIQIDVRRQWMGGYGNAVTNQRDAESLEGAVRAAERSVRPPFGLAPERSYTPPSAVLPMPPAKIWGDTTYNLTAEARAKVAQGLVEAAEAQGLLSAGYIEVRAGSWWQTINGVPYYIPYTQAQCSVTVRDKEGTGSGWAGLSSYDWAKIDAPGLAKRALDKCVASRNPVALEPGRYTVILEPQAVADLLDSFVYGEFDRSSDENSVPCCRPLQLSPGQSKLGLKVMDDRLTLSHDPADPDLGIIPEPGLKPVTWIDKGVVTALAYDRRYALSSLRENEPVQSPSIAYRLSGGGPPTSVEQMIATTQRGILVTRFWDVRGSSGLTRDGLWLIENGKISKAIKNFRFVQSPLVALNQVDQIGTPVPVFRPVRNPAGDIRFRQDLSGPPPLLTPAVVPALKVRDFSFTAMADAV